MTVLYTVFITARKGNLEHNFLEKKAKENAVLALEKRNSKKIKNMRNDQKL